MITKDNLIQVLEELGFSCDKNIYTKKFETFDCDLRVDFENEKIIYPKNLIVNEEQTLNFKANENFVVLECVHRLLEKGYHPEHIELEPKWKVGHGASGGRADILVKDNGGKSLLIIECKTAGIEFSKEWNKTKEDGGQLFGYAQQEKDTKFLCLYASDFVDEKIKSDYYLITLQDNKKYLTEKPDLKGFLKAKIREELFSVWKNTYEQDFQQKGLFENDIQTYEIGKKNFSLADLDAVDSGTKQEKHHKFATILRKYNVSGRENAFDKLVNLFLCKIVDEQNNSKNLQFYYKGVAYDTPFDLQDRLQRLYREGMREFLEEEVTYIENVQIDNAFTYFKDDPDATKDTIKKYFKQLKFFTNNDFSFIDVHNEKLFYQNSKVLIDIVRLFQNTKIKSDNKNQFLGDMFENFLDGGIKQSEGQYFTPMPITKFIIQSLPLKQIITENSNVPKAIDYACGSGHFLNELASQMLPFIEENKDVKTEDYYKNIYGIEKEYRLSKVAKVSAFMYGQDEIDISYTDALIQNEKFRNGSFNILVANPPYSVKGFLETLPKKDRANFELFQKIDKDKIATNNSIECFFIEKAKQLLAGNGVGAIIVPSSILSNKDKTYTKTREILLAYFDVVGITEFGSGAFGETGTNTVTLFLRRKNEIPEQAEHYKIRVNSWFNNENKKQDIFKDEHFIKAYCEYINIDFEDYKSLLENKPSEEFLQSEMFATYKKSFDNSTSVENLKKKKYFKEKNEEDKTKELDELFLKYLQEIEKDKIYYFVLAKNQKNKVVIVKAPSDNKEGKQFLGYKWSKAKGNEGIKLDIDENGKHKTPLYDSENRNNKEKINFLIKQNFSGEDFEIPENLQEFVSLSDLPNMLDFSRIEFNKEISLTAKKTVEIKTKWDLVKLGDLCNHKAGGTPSRNKEEYWRNGTINWLKINDYKDLDYILDTEEKITELGLENSSAKILEMDTIVVSIFATIARVGIIKKRMVTNQAIVGLTPINKEKLNFNYLINAIYFYSDILKNEAIGMAQPNINTTKLLNFKIPLPPKEIQEKIVSECEKIDKEKTTAEENITKAKGEIEENFEKLYKNANHNFRLNNTDDFDIVIGKRVLKKEIENPKNTIPVYSANVFEPFGFIDKLHIKDFEKPSIVWGIDGDWQVNYLPANYEFYPTDHCGIIRVRNKNIHPKYLSWVLNKIGIEKRFSRSNRASTDRIKNLSIPAPPIAEQKELIAKIEIHEQVIEKANRILENVEHRKQKVLEEYL